MLIRLVLSDQHQLECLPLYLRAASTRLPRRGYMFIIRFLLLSLLICLSTVSLSHAQAQAPATSTAEPPKVAELLRLLEDADVKTWLAQRQAAVPEKGAAEVARVIDDLEVRSRTRLNILLSAVPRVGSELYRAASSVQQEAHDSGFAPGILMIGIIAGIGFCTEWFLRRSVPAVTLPNQTLVADADGVCATLDFHGDGCLRLSYLSLAAAHACGRALFARRDGRLPKRAGALPAGDDRFRADG